MRYLPALLCVLFPLLPALAQDAKKPETKPAEAKEKAKQKIPSLKLSGAFADLAEQAFDPTALLMGGGGKPPKPFFELIDKIDELGKDAAVSTILLDLSEGVHFNLPQQREVERSLGRLRGAGKKLVCYLEGADTSTYQVAAQCDRVLMADMGAVDLRSPAMSIMFLKDAFDLLGISFEVSRVGEFKGAVEPYTRADMSEHLREHYRKMLESMNQDIVRRIASGRRLDAAKVRELQGQRLFQAKDAMVAGLIDKLVPWTGAKRALAMELGNDDFELADAMPKKAKKSRDLFSLLGELLKGKKETEIEDPQIVVLELSGTIVDGSTDSPGNMVSGPTVKLIDKLADSEQVKGVVVRINSPGGSATASEAIRLGLQRLAAKKPVVFSMGELAASGGYWITTIGKPIFAEPGTITGSIGVFSLRMQMGALMRRLGLHDEMIALDDSATWDATDRPWGDDAKARVQAFVDDVYDRFLTNVAASRRLDTKTVDSIGGGRVWSGAQAVELKLVDTLGGLGDALAMVKKQAGVADDIEVDHLPKPRSFADTLFEGLFESSVMAGERGRLATLLQQFGRIDTLVTLLRQALAGDTGGKVWALLPGDLRVR